LPSTSTPLPLPRNLCLRITNAVAQVTDLLGHELDRLPDLGDVAEVLAHARRAHVPHRLTRDPSHVHLDTGIAVRDEPVQIAPVNRLERLLRQLEIPCRHVAQYRP